jgi:hypothetical protein
MKTAVELVEALCFKLHMMEVSLEGPVYIKADNMSVVKKSSMPESMLWKKSNGIAYHYVREQCAQGVCVISYDNTETNLADMLTKIQLKPVRNHLARMVLY